MSMNKICSVCHCEFESESADVLAFGAFGAARYLCDGCAKDFDETATGKEISEIDGAIDRISKKMMSARVDDEIVLSTVKEIMIAARERREKIRAGEYDFSEDEEMSAEEIPEELRETEEDVETERLEAEKNKRYDKITNIVCVIFLILALGFFAYRILTSYFI